MTTKYLIFIMEYVNRVGGWEKMGEDGGVVEDHKMTHVVLEHLKQ